MAPTEPPERGKPDGPESQPQHDRARDPRGRDDPSRDDGSALELAEAFGYLGLTVFTSYFLNYAATELDVPTGPAAPVLR
jgi:hypothetical protein